MISKHYVICDIRWAGYVESAFMMASYIAVTTALLSERSSPAVQMTAGRRLLEAGTVF
jgi:hypothetical protein